MAWLGNVQAALRESRGFATEGKHIRPGEIPVFRSSGNLDTICSVLSLIAICFRSLCGRGRYHRRDMAGQFLRDA
jgi:hypothetical protein